MVRLSFVLPFLGVTILVAALGYYFLNTKTTIGLPALPTLLSSNPSSTVLPQLIDDCLVSYNASPKCIPTGSTLTFRSMIQDSVAGYVQQQPTNPRLQQYTEDYVLAELNRVFPNLQLPPLANQPNARTIPLMIAYSVDATKTNPKLLIALMEENNQWWTNPDANSADPYGQPIKHFFYQTLDVANRLQLLYQEAGTKKTLTVIDRANPENRKNYTFASDVGKGSIAVYYYLATISQNPDDFEHRTSLDFKEASLNIHHIWNSLYGEDIQTTLIFSAPVPKETRDPNQAQPSLN